MYAEVDVREPTRSGWVEVPLLFFNAFTLPYSEGSRVPILFWANRERVSKILRSSWVESGFFSASGGCFNHTATVSPYEIKDSRKNPIVCPHDGSFKVPLNRVKYKLWSFFPFQARCRGLFWSTLDIITFSNLCHRSCSHLYIHV